MMPPASQCRLPIAYESSSFCSKKKAYNLIFINPGSTYQSLVESYTCLPQGKNGDREVISCSGTKTKTYQIRVCDPACAAAQTASAQCPQGYAYNDLNQCCVQQPPVTGDEGCVILTLEAPQCMIKCKAFNNDYTGCLNNAHSCIWTEGRCMHR
jgi:hypothetical protein